MYNPKTVQIKVWNEQGWELDQEMLAKCLMVAHRHMGSGRVKFIDIYPQERIPEDAPEWKHPGWLEWGVEIEYDDMGKLFIGVIQRTVGAEYECHT